MLIVSTFIVVSDSKSPGEPKFLEAFGKKCSGGT